MSTVGLFGWGAVNKSRWLEKPEGKRQPALGLRSWRASCRGGGGCVQETWRKLLHSWPLVEVDLKFISLVLCRVEFPSEQTKNHEEMIGCIDFRTGWEASSLSGLQHPRARSWGLHFPTWCWQRFCYIFWYNWETKRKTERKRPLLQAQEGCGKVQVPSDWNKEVDGLLLGLPWGKA